MILQDLTLREAAQSFRLRRPLRLDTRSSPMNFSPDLGSTTLPTPTIKPSTMMHGALPATTPLIVRSCTELLSACMSIFATGVMDFGKSFIFGGALGNAGKATVSTGNSALRIALRRSTLALFLETTLRVCWMTLRPRGATGLSIEAVLPGRASSIKTG